MMTRSKCLPAAVFALLLAAGAGAKEGRKPDAWITTKVKSTFATHKNVSALRTNVETKNGVVTLRGEVDTTAEKDLAERYAKSVEGVKRVDNQLVIKGDENEEDRSETDRSGDEGGSSMGDAGLTTRVKAALAGNRSTSAFRTDVDSENGEVILRGTARSAAEKDMAEKVVREVKGVKSVENRIDVQ